MDASLWGIFVTVAIAHFLALLSPGPDFVLVVKSAIKNNGKNAIGIALGIALANALYITLCLVGVGSILAASIFVMVGLKIIGGLFLIYLAIQALRARKSLPEPVPPKTCTPSNESRTVHGSLGESITKGLSKFI